MDVLTFETRWAVNNEIIKQVTSVGLTLFNEWLLCSLCLGETSVGREGFVFHVVKCSELLLLVAVFISLIVSSPQLKFPVIVRQVQSVQWNCAAAAASTGILCYSVSTFWRTGNYCISCLNCKGRAVRGCRSNRMISDVTTVAYLITMDSW